MGLNAPSFARHKSADQPLQEIISDRDDEVLDPLLKLGDAVRSAVRLCEFISSCSPIRKGSAG